MDDWVNLANSSAISTNSRRMHKRKTRKPPTPARFRPIAGELGQLCFDVVLFIWQTWPILGRLPPMFGTLGRCWADLERCSANLVDFGVTSARFRRPIPGRFRPTRFPIKMCASVNPARMLTPGKVESATPGCACMQIRPHGLSCRKPAATPPNLHPLESEHKVLNKCCSGASRAS